MLPSLATSILGYSLTFLLSTVCIAIGILILVLIPVGILKILEESKYLSREDIQRIMTKLRLKRIEDGKST